MTAVIGPPTLQAAAAEAKAYLRVVGAQEDALIERLVGSATALCEAFTGRWLMARAATETVPARAQWRRLAATPVRSIAGVDAVPIEGAAVALAAGAFAIDIDANGDGWVRVHDAGPPPTSGRTGRVRVRFEAGMATVWTDLPEPIRQGIVRLVTHLFTHRDGADGGDPPTAVTALWRPFRRVRL